MSLTLKMLILNDLRLQMRNGIFIAYAFVLIFYVLALVFLGQHLPDWAAALIIYTDPIVVGFFFLGALMMLEKAEGTRTALAITPMRATHYFWSKTLTLTSLSLFAVTILALFLHEPVNWPLYLVSTLLTSLTFTSISFPIALHFKTATSYLMGAAAALIPLTLPIFIALNDPVSPWALVFPTTAQFRLILVSLGTYPASLTELSVTLSVVFITSLGSIFWGLHAIKQEFGQK
ncbi:MAG: hypothetical protein L3J13_03000 [Devosiaceae bacterium]|nr:hypothetical protein [Devosiaceae bacterium]